jgi:hypothetical protein
MLFNNSGALSKPSDFASKQQEQALAIGTHQEVQITLVPLVIETELYYDPGSKELKKLRKANGKEGDISWYPSITVMNSVVDIILRSLCGKYKSTKREWSEGYLSWEDRNKYDLKGHLVPAWTVGDTDKRGKIYVLDLDHNARLAYPSPTVPKGHPNYEANPTTIARDKINAWIYAALKQERDSLIDFSEVNGKTVIVDVVSRGEGYDIRLSKRQAIADDMVAEATASHRSRVRRRSKPIA